VKGHRLQNQGRNYYLDFLRALAIMLVFTGHTVLSAQADSLTFLRFGGSGVDLFFLLSGWLIGSQLYAERKKFGNIDIKRFWFRRWLRTLPAYFVILLATLTQLYLTKDSVSNPLPYFFFVQNYFSTLEYFLISWSLAVEEQFYLIIAPLIVILMMLPGTVLKLLGLIVLLMLPSVFRLLGMYDDLLQTHVRWDCCLMGVLLAYVHKNIPKAWKIMSNGVKYLIFPFVALYISFFFFRVFPPFEGYADPSKLVLAVIFGTFIVASANHPVTALPFFHRLIMHISTRSYSIYLLHPEALALANKLIPQQHFIFYYSFALLTTLIAAEFLYRLVEIPFIKGRERFDMTRKRELAV
jgi:peptidoglycan/LPS O-acetylase OafA/YrhL